MARGGRVGRVGGATGDDDALVLGQPAGDLRQGLDGDPGGRGGGVGVGTTEDGRGGAAVALLVRDQLGQAEGESDLGARAWG